MYIIISVILAFLLDLMIGDPQGWYHPICTIGNLISKSEKVIRKRFPKTSKGEFWGGVVMSILIMVLCFIVPFGILFIAKSMHVYLYIAIQTIFCYQILAVNSLKKESMRVYNALEKQDILEARKYLSWIVGRDTKDLDDTAIIKATVETIAENTTDGVVAPLIYMLIGGAPLAFLYKGINTMDSMVGYKNDKYLYFGRFAAKIDDVANFIPARITAVIMIICSAFIGLNAKNATKIFLRDRKNHASPNSAQTESVCAGALEVQLAGDAYYFGKLYKKPFIGDKIRDINKTDIKKTNDLMYCTAVFSLILAVLLRYMVIV